ncbi:phosphoglycerate dehydrogenase [Streptomyces sp. NPDC093085]|uniref:phosphoglycerate dehydrogenase n=1 Tax=Streptomyces sp. NPDC093085 TaxID=3155068 RepID=UPI003422A73D
MQENNHPEQAPQNNTQNDARNDLQNDARNDPRGTPQNSTRNAPLNRENTPTGESILITTPSFAQTSRAPWEIFEAAGFPAHRTPSTHPLPEARLATEAAEITALVVGLDPVTAAVFEAAPRLKVVAKHGVGTDNIDLDAARERGVRVVNAPGTNTGAVADQTFALLLAVARKIVPAHVSVTEGRWDRFFGRELAGRTLGVVGFGRIGQAVARRARGFDMEVVAYDPHLPPEVFAEAGVRSAPFPDLLPACDAITLHLPLAPDAGPLLGRQELAALRPGALVLNTARGGLVDEEALAELLHSGHLGGAGIDVFSAEPPAGNPLLGAPNTVLTPHCAAFGDQANRAMGMAVATDVVRVLRGEPPRNAVV